VLLRLNKSGQLREPFYLVYPKEGIITADYPLLLINPGQRATYQKVVTYLRSPAFQQKLMAKTFRRPVNPKVKRSSDFPTQLQVELPFPASLEVVNHLLSASLDPQVKPVHTYYVLDISQPMKGSRLDSLKKALYTLTGADTGLANRFARYHNREKVTMIAFNSHVFARQDFDIDLSQLSSLRLVQDYANGLHASGGSALYSALAQAYQQAVRDKSGEPDRVYAIVLMSYGQNNAGISEKMFLSGYRRLAGAREIRMFTLFFGEEDIETMRDIANETSGRMLIAGQEPIAVIFNEIRGYE
jgi:Ca-activated chloride channel family protein